MQEEGKHMLAQGYGKIINTASMATLLVPHPQKQIAYNASKAAVVKITQTLGTEWADRGLNVNCISPGIVNTALIQVGCHAVNCRCVEWLLRIVSACMPSLACWHEGMDNQLELNTTCN